MKTIDYFTVEMIKYCNNRYYFCTEKMIACVSAHYNINFELIFNNSWDFVFSPEVDECNGVQIKVDYGNLYLYFRNYYGFDRISIENNDKIDLWEYSLKQLLKNNILSINMQYKSIIHVVENNRVNNVFMIVGYDEKKRLKLIDPIYPSKPIYIEKDIFNQKCITIHIFKRKNKIDISSLKKQVAIQFEEVKNKFIQMLNSFDKILYHFERYFDLQKEINCFYYDYFNSFTYKMLFIVNSRVSFVECLKNCDFPEKQSAHLVIENLIAASTKWEKAHLLLQKFILANKKTIDKKMILELFSEAISFEIKAMQEFNKLSLQQLIIHNI